MAEERLSYSRQLREASVASKDAHVRQADALERIAAALEALVDIAHGDVAAAPAAEEPAHKVDAMAIATGGGMFADKAPAPSEEV